VNSVKDACLEQLPMHIAIKTAKVKHKSVLMTTQIHKCLLFICNNYAAGISFASSSTALWQQQFYVHTALATVTTTNCSCTVGRPEFHQRGQSVSPAPPTYYIFSSFLSASSISPSQSFLWVGWDQ